MKIKAIRWNWGTGIGLVYAAFVVSILAFVVSSSRKQIDLVAPDYYAKELAFQGQLDKAARSRALTEPLKWEQADRSLQLQFPAQLAGEEISGRIHFFCPANARQDRQIEIQSADLQQRISLQDFAPGRYRMQIDWLADGSSYYDEGEVYIRPHY